MNDRVSVIIPARNEAHLKKTVVDLLAHAAGDIEILVFLDGPQPDPQLPADARIRVIWNDPAIGMRPCINAGAELATGKYLLKVDAHCMFAPGYDAALRADCDEDWLAVPTRHSIDGETWRVKGRDYNYSILTYPYLASMYGEGLHAVTFPWNQNKAVNAARAHLLVDDLLSAQGSCWFQHRANFLRLGPLDHANLYFYQESQETMLRQWVTGGRCVINKRTWYAHWHKGKESQGADGRPGRGYYLDVRKKRSSEAFSTDWWLNNRQPGAQRTFVSLIEQFWPLLAEMTDPRYAWPADWRDFEKHRKAFAERPADQIPAHT